MKKAAVVHTVSAASLLVSAVLAFSAAKAQTYTVVHSFSGSPDGSVPVGSLSADAQGNFYGVTNSGGDLHCDSPYGCGTVYRLDSAGKETVIYRFHGDTDGGHSDAGVVRDENGNLYGTTGGGGSSGAGTVFMLDRSGKKTILYSFAGGSDGADPFSGVIRDRHGNLYGTTSGGGNRTVCPLNGCGVVYRVGPDGKEKVLHTFGGPPDGDYSLAGVIMDAAGNLYGTTNGGGTGTCGGQGGCGVVFKIDLHGTETVLHNFTGTPNDGESPDAALILDSAGNLYGTTYSGGTYGYGTLFKLSSAGTETILYNFTGGTDGGNPASNLTRDSQGNLYGTTYSGGSTTCGYMGFGCGVVFRLDTQGNYESLYIFNGTTDGSFPSWGGLFLDSAGILHGVASSGGIISNGDDNGVVFQLNP